MKKVLVIGGGIIGHFSAYYLTKSGHEVVVLDDNPQMTPASEGNCGLVTPSHILPLNSKSAILQGIKWLGKKNAPLKIKPQLNGAFIRWFLNFMKHSNPSDIQKATLARHQLLQLSFQLYEEFFQNEPTKAEWNKGGLLYVCKDKKSMQHFIDEIALHKEFKMQSRILSANEVFEEEPLLKSDMVGGALMEMDGWLNPNQLLKDITRINEVNGVRYQNEIVKSFHSDGKKINAVITNKGEHIADEIILCAGAASPILANKLGVKLAVIPGKGYNLTSKTDQPIQLRRPIYMGERKVVATPWKAGFRIGSTMEFTGYDLALNQSRLQALKEAAGEYLKVDFDQFEFVPWAGWRPMKDDGIPIIERSQKINNLIIATGHSMVGLSMAPATGSIVEKLVSED